ncbi:hypothetical protein SLS58_006755 [Diplodia intermedia]|uniref:Uncharacterized protein n=1 Tax=Diplodia intermedia TaxID=856260 RepID=A0ABR3TLY4_9PEZI
MKRMVGDMQKRKAMPSMVTMQAQNLDEMPTDVGLMPATLGAIEPGELALHFTSSEDVKVEEIVLELGSRGLI